MNWLEHIEVRFTAPRRAAFWITIVGLGFTLTMMSVKEVSRNLHILGAALFRCPVGLVFMVPWLMRMGKKGLKTPQPTRVITRGVFAYFVSGFYFLAAKLVPLADILLIRFTRPIFGTNAAILVLHEVAHPSHWSAIGFRFIGMLLVLSGVVIQTGNTIVLKLLAKTESPNIIAFYHSLVIILVAIIFAFIVWVTPKLEQWCRLIALGATGILTQWTQSRAFTAADASYVLAFAVLRLLIAAFLGFLIFDEVPEIRVWIGAAVICASSTYIARSEAKITNRRV